MITPLGRTLKGGECTSHSSRDGAESLCAIELCALAYVAYTVTSMTMQAECDGSTAFTIKGSAITHRLHHLPLSLVMASRTQADHGQDSLALENRATQHHPPGLWQATHLVSHDGYAMPCGFAAARHSRRHTLANPSASDTCNIVSATVLMDTDGRKTYPSFVL